MPKRPKSIERPFPWRCRNCGKRRVILARLDYEAEVRHDGRLHKFLVPDLELPVCQACGARAITDRVDREINDQLRAHLGLLHPSQMRDALTRLAMTQKELAKRLGIAQETLSRWLNETQIQSRAMDNLLRLFFALPAVRSVLSGDDRDRSLGTVDLPRPPEVHST